MSRRREVRSPPVLAISAAQKRSATSAKSTTTLQHRGTVARATRRCSSDVDDQALRIPQHVWLHARTRPGGGGLPASGSRTSSATNPIRTTWHGPTTIFGKCNCGAHLVELTSARADTMKSHCMALQTCPVPVSAYWSVGTAAVGVPGVGWRQYEPLHAAVDPDSRTRNTCPLIPCAFIVRRLQDLLVIRSPTTASPTSIGWRRSISYSTCSILPTGAGVVAGERRRSGRPSGIAT
jgi:hypothetical protein